MTNETRINVHLFLLDVAILCIVLLETMIYIGY